MLGMIGIGFQGSRLGRLPEWGKGDGVTRVVWAAIYAESRHPLFVFSYQVKPPCDPAPGDLVRPG